LLNKGEARQSDVVAVDGERHGFGLVKYIYTRSAVEQIKGEYGSFVVPGNDHHLDAGPFQIQNGLDQIVLPPAGYIILVEKIAAVDQQIGLQIPGIFHHSAKILKDSIPSAFAPVGIRLF
jgi:hypothetical protein